LYLEYVIHELDDTTPEFHNRLSGYYMEQIQAELKQNGGQHDDTVEYLRLKLRQFLNDSNNYRPAMVLSRLPFEGFYEERAILLSKLGEHDQALNIYVYKMKNYRMAEEYCNKVFNSNPDIYLTLLKVYLQPTGSESPLLEPALELLSRHGSHINASEALRMLPASTKMDKLYPFFEKYVRESNRQHNMNLIVKNLWNAQKLQTEEQLVYYRSRSVKITEDRMCPQCNKRILNSVFAVFPNGVVVHYSCKEKIESMRWKLK
jgi:tetratricopeptide (TPR) repeat protein